MKLLQKALYDRWLSTPGASLRALATGGFHALQASQSARAPYIVWTPLQGGESGATSMDAAARIDIVHSQFAIFVDDGQLDLAYSIRDALVTLYDGYAPNSGGLRVHGVYRKNPGTPVKDPDVGWMLVVEYEHRLSGL